MPTRCVWLCRSTGHRGIHRHVGDEDPLQAVADALADFPADAIAKGSPSERRRASTSERMRTLGFDRFTANADFQALLRASWRQ
jgi:hypothetical protein